jgi:hypothetical protein
MLMGSSFRSREMDKGRIAAVAGCSMISFSSFTPLHEILIYSRLVLCDSDVVRDLIYRQNHELSTFSQLPFISALRLFVHFTYIINCREIFTQVPKIPTNN